MLAELEAYAPLVSEGSYCMFDTLIENMPAETLLIVLGPGENPKTAVWEYLKTHPEFVIDKQMDHKLLNSVAPEVFETGWAGLRRHNGLIAVTQLSISPIVSAKIECIN